MDIEYRRISDGTLEHTLEMRVLNPTVAAVSQDGQIIAVGGPDGTVWVYDSLGETVLFTVSGGGYAAQLALSTDGKLLAIRSAADNKAIQVWSVPDGTLLHTLTGHNDTVIGLSFSPDSRMLASVGNLKDKTVRIWDLDDGSLIQSFDTYGFIVSRAAFSPDGKMIAMAAEADGKGIQVRQVSDGALLYTLTGYGMASGSIAFSPDGTLLAASASSFQADTVSVWDITDGTLVRNLLLSYPGGYVVTGIRFPFRPMGSTCPPGTSSGISSSIGKGSWLGKDNARVGGVSDVKENHDKKRQGSIQHCGYHENYRQVQGVSSGDGGRGCAVCGANEFRVHDGREYPDAVFSQRIGRAQDRYTCQKRCGVLRDGQ